MVPFAPLFLKLSWCKLFMIIIVDPTQEVMKWTQKMSNLFLPFEFKSNASDVLYGDFAYGLGLFIGTYDGNPTLTPRVLSPTSTERSCFFLGFERIGHGGYLPPYTSLMTFLPALNIGLFTTANGPGAAVNTAHIMLHEIILNILQSNRSTFIQLAILHYIKTNYTPKFQPKYCSVLSPNVGMWKWNGSISSRSTVNG